jgi:hypothetical protein
MSSLICRLIAIGSLVMGMVAVLMLWPKDADAQCPPSALRRIGGRAICSTPTSGGGTIVLVVAEGFEQDANFNQACNVITDAELDGPEGDGGIGLNSTTTPPPTSLLVAGALQVRLLGTKGRNCGPDKNETCDIKGVKFCGPLPALATMSGGHDDDDDDDDDKDRDRNRECMRGKEADTPGPLTISAPQMGQTDGSARSFSGFRFQLAQDAREDLCPSADNKEFLSFVAKEGFFETCRGSEDGDVCQTLLCKLDVKNLCKEEVRVYSCKVVSSSQ